MTLKKLSTLEENIKKRIIGQDEAVAAVCAAVKRSRVQITAHRRPGVIYICGADRRR